MSQISETPRKQFQDILNSFATAMLVTKTPDGSLRARPMAVARCDSDSDLWFVTDADSGKIDELAADPRVAVVMQHDNRFLSLSGDARMARDPARVSELWDDAWSEWFPNGADDADLIVVHVVSRHGEFWDAGSLEGMEYVFEAGKALLKGQTPDEQGEYGEVKLNRD